MAQITFAIPTYNRKDFLKQAIESVLKQTFQDFEIIVFDNASTAYDVSQFLESFKDTRITLNRNSQNIAGFSNMARALNYSFATPYVMAFHDDDYLHPLALEIIMKNLNQHPEAALAFSYMNFVSNPSAMEVFPENSLDVNFKGQLIDTGEFTRVILNNKPVCFSTIVYNTKKIIDLETLSEFSIWRDRPLLLEMSKKGGAVIIEQNLVNYRVHKSQISQGKEPASEANQFLKKLMSYYLSCLPKPLSPKDEALFYGFTSSSLLRSLARSKNFSDFRNILKDLKDSGLLKINRVSARGWYYLFKDTLKRLAA